MSITSASRSLFNDPEKLITDIIIPGSHNACFSVAYNWFYAMQNITLDKFFKLPIHWLQKRSGVFCQKNIGGPNIVSAHEFEGGNNCNSSYLQKCFQYPELIEPFFYILTKFLKNNPKEIVILKLESYVGQAFQKDINGATQFSNFELYIQLNNILEKSGLKQRAFKLNNKRIPKVKQLQSGKNLIITIDEPDLNLFPDIDIYVNYEGNFLVSTYYKDHPITNEFSKLVSYNPNFNVEKDLQNFFELHLSPEFALDPYSVYKSCYNAYNRIKIRNEACYDKYKRYPNILQTNFIEIGDIIRFVFDINLGIQKRNYNITIKQEMEQKQDPPIAGEKKAASTNDESSNKNLILKQ